MKNVHNSDNNYIYQLPQGTKRKNVYTNDKDKNNIHTLMQQIKSLAVFDMESEKFNQCYDFIVKINV